MPRAAVRPARLAGTVATVLTFAALPSASSAQGVRGPDIPVRPPGQPSVTTGWKDEHRARVLGTLVPGLGHVYAEEYSNGRDLFTVSVVGIGVGGVLLLIAPESDNQTSTLAIGGALAALGVGAWVWSAIDAPRAARRTNAKRILHRSAGLTPYVGSAPGGALVLGVSHRLSR